MRIRWLALLATLALVVAACSGDEPELSTESTIVTGGTNPAEPAGSTTTPGGDNGVASPSTSLVGQTVTGFTVVAEIPNDDGVTQLIVIPEGAYTDVDLENFVVDLIEGNPDLYGAEIFGDEAAAQAFMVPEADRTDEQNVSLETDWYLTLTGRSRIDYRGPFSDFSGTAIGS